jgi:uncharacterized protein (TIGR00290 family)
MGMNLERPRCVLNWSSGKDSAWALHLLREAGDVDVVGLLTTVNEEFDRVTMHAVRRELLLGQAHAVGLPLTIVALPSSCTHEDYELRMGEVVQRLKSEGVEAMAFGDLYLQDVREYRERQLSKVGLRALFPLWKQPSDEVASRMLDAGMRAVVTCVDPRALDHTFVGREWNTELLRDLPESVDPCGENGEFHTFVYDGPVFSHPLSVERGEVLERDGFVFRDVRLR